MKHPRFVKAEPLTKDNFLPFGDIVRLSPTAAEMINYGAAQAQRDLARVEVGAEGQTRIGVYRALPRTSPTPLALMEKHPLGTQAFVPMGGKPWLAVVASSLADGRVGELCARYIDGDTALNYHRKVWHHPLLSVAEQDFAVIDRCGAGDNLCEQIFSRQEVAWLFFAEANLGGCPAQTFAPSPSTMSEDYFIHIFSPLVPGGAWVAAEIWRHHLSLCNTVAGFHQAMAQVILTASEPQQREILTAEQLLPSSLPRSEQAEASELLLRYQRKFGFPLAHVAEASLLPVVRRRVARDITMAELERAESFNQIFRLARARLSAWAHS